MEHPTDIRHRASMIARQQRGVRPDVSVEDVLWMTDTITELCDELQRQETKP